MSQNSSALSTLNVSNESYLQEEEQYFELSAPPNTRLIRDEQSQDIITAPIIYTTSPHPFRDTQITILTPRTSSQCIGDEGGLVIFVGGAPGDSYRNELPRWATAGVEIVEDNRIRASSTVTKDQMDWSSFPLPHDTALLCSKFERLGDSLWISYSYETSHEPHVLVQSRQINGFFTGIEDQMIYIGAYAARPGIFDPAVSTNLAFPAVFEFEHFVINGEALECLTTFEG